MNQKINIGPGTDIDLTDLLESRMLVQANSGGGKSGIARVMIEETHGLVPCIIIDKAGEYYTLKEEFADIIIIGGQYADIPLSMQAAKLLPKMIITNRLSVIIDLSGEGMDNDKRVMYVKDFLQALMNLPQQYWMAYLIFLEEAHLFCGQQDKQPSGKYVKQLMSEGRKMGYCGILITQRISKLHKDAAAEANNKFIGRTFLDLDMDRSASEMGISSKDKLKLRDLKKQHFYAFGTSIEPHNVHEVVVKDAKTKFPKVGTNMVIKPKKPTGKVLEMMAKLNELPKVAARELQDIKELKTEITRLEKEIAGKKIPQSSDQSKSNQLVQSLQDDVAKWKKICQGYDEQLVQSQANEKKLRKAIEKSLKWQSEAKDLLVSASGVLVSDSTVTVPVVIPEMPKGNNRIANLVQAKPATNGRVEPIRQRASIQPESNGTLTKGEKTVLIALAQYPDGMTRQHISVLTGYASSTRNEYLRVLESKMAAEKASGGKMKVTEHGISLLGSDFTPLPEGKELQTFWLSNLPQGERTILEQLINHYPATLTREEISDKTGYANSTRNEYLRVMVVKQIIEVDRNGVKASALLFD